MKNPKRLLVAVTLLVAALPLQAADISWGSAQDITGDSDVITDGTLVYAFDLGLAAGTDTTINGVTFTSTTTAVSGQLTANSPGLGWGYTGFGAASGDFASLSSDYQSILQSAQYYTNSAAGGVAVLSYNLEGLIVGQTYQIQVWSNDSRDVSGAKKGGSTYASSGGDSVTLQFNNTNVLGGLGQYAVGTFTADAATQTFTITAFDTSSGSYNTQINALQLRAIPEPKTSCLFLGVSVLVVGTFLRVRTKTSRHGG